MGAGKIAMLLRFPVGVVAGITPFNAPFNLAAHKIAPAIAAGNVIVLKPPPQAPLTVHKLVEMFVDAGTPPGVLNVVYGQEVGPASRPRSARGLHHLHRLDAGRRRDQGGLGSAPGRARARRHRADDRPRRRRHRAAAPMCARNAMRLAGQSCISVQNIYAHESVYDRFVDALAAEIRRLKVGDPLDPETDVGTLIDVERGQAGRGVGRGGGRRRRAGADRRRSAPARRSSRRSGRRGSRDEGGLQRGVRAGRPRCSATRTSTRSSRRSATSPYGLQCGIFTGSVTTAIDAARRLRTGGVIINGTSTWRTDQLAYGGVKSSGIGREGPRYAIRDMTEERLVVFNM